MYTYISSTHPNPNTIKYVYVLNNGRKVKYSFKTIPWLRVFRAKPDIQLLFYTISSDSIKKTTIM